MSDFVRISFLLFCSALVLGTGCVITDYPVISDPYTREVVNTQGKALIKSSQVANIWSDGSDNLLTYVDQKSSGDQTLVTYNYYTTDGSYFLDYEYCHPDWHGCAVSSSPNPVGGDDPFDWYPNLHCRGYRSIGTIKLLGERYSECGRAEMSAVDRAAFLAALPRMSPNRVGLTLHRANTSFMVDNHAGVTDTIPIFGSMRVEAEFRNSRTYAVVNMTDPIFGNTLLMLHDWVVQHQGESVTASFSVNGFDLGSYHVKFIPEGLEYNARR